MNSIKNFIYGLMCEGSPLSSKRFTGIVYALFNLLFQAAFFYYLLHHCTNFNLICNVFEFTIVVDLLIVLLCFSIATMKDILQLKSNQSLPDSSISPIKEIVKDDTNNQG